MSKERDLLDALIPCPTCQQLGTITQKQMDKRTEVIDKANTNYLWAEEKRRDAIRFRAWVVGICLVVAAAISGGTVLLYNHLSYKHEKAQQLEITCTQDPSLETCSCLEAQARTIEAEEQKGGYYGEECEKAHAKVTQCYRDLAVRLIKDLP